jgi:hypothetical protein
MRGLPIALVLALAACEGSDGGATDAGSARDTGRVDVDSGEETGVDGGGMGMDDGGTELDSGGDPPIDGGGSGGSASAWIIEHFAGDPVVTGDFTARTMVETPALVRDATGCCGKYAFDVREESAPDQREVGFVDVDIRDLASTDAFGGGILSGYAPGLVLYLSDVVIEPNWPLWVDYSTTNMDGLVLDDASAIYAEDLTVRSWNADGAIDNKAPISQFVRLTIEGRGNRAMRYWGDGPHYLVESNLNNEGGAGEGSIFWFSNCDTTEVRIYASTFNGSSTVPETSISCDNGSAPTLVYLTTDPRTTGEMHEMFTP